MGAKRRTRKRACEGPLFCWATPIPPRRAPRYRTIQYRLVRPGTTGPERDPRIRTEPGRKINLKARWSALAGLAPCLLYRVPAPEGASNQNQEIP
jgi:hypothetical protein